MCRAAQHGACPAIASLVPTSAGFALLIDAGANTEVKAVHLMQFGVMGSVYWRRVHDCANPRVAILSNGEEASKGTDLTRAAAQALSQMAPHINYTGYVEGRDINKAKADVVVTDGFTGNVTLKTMEGFASFLLGNLRDIFTSGILQRLAYLIIRKRLTRIRERFDPSEYGGAPLLGVNGVAIIAHGSSNARAIRNAIRAAANESLVHAVNAEITEILAAHSPETMIVKPSSKGIRGLFGRMRDRLHIHREAHPEHKIERFSKGEKSDRPEKHERPEKHNFGAHLDAVHAETHPAAMVSTPHEDIHFDSDAVNHVAPIATGANGSVSDAHAPSADGHEPNPEHREHDTPSADDHHPAKGGNS